jgi:hypothetical protein
MFGVQEHQPRSIGARALSARRADVVRLLIDPAKL